MNAYTATHTLFYKEVLRFWKVGLQTIAAPVLAALLYMLIFGHVLRNSSAVYPGVDYLAFLVPGLVMMSVLQNAIANSSSSLIQSKVMGNLIFILLTPISWRAWFIAYVGASVVRALCVGFGVWLCTLPFTLHGGAWHMAAPLWVIMFAVFGGTTMGALGIVAGLWAEKFDQLATFQNFLVMPLTFLSGTFYSIHSLPPFWQTISHLNPLFYVVDGFRYGFFGYSDVSPWLSLAVVGSSCAVVCALTLALLRSGYNLRT